LCAGRRIPDLEDCKKYASGLKGVRLGLYDLDYEDKKVQYPAFHEAIHLLEDLGAEIVPFTPPKDAGRDMDKVLFHEFRPAMDAALRRGTGNVRSMADIASYNNAHTDECLRYGQTWIEKALALQRPMLTPEYIQAREAAHKALRELEQSFAELSIDAVISPLCLIAFPVTGCPSLALPVGIDEAEGIPVPLVLNGLPFSEGKLLAIGAALEAALGKNIYPVFSK
jgi:amidase